MEECKFRAGDIGYCYTDDTLIQIKITRVYQDEERFDNWYNLELEDGGTDFSLADFFDTAYEKSKKEARDKYVDLARDCIENDKALIKNLQASIDKRLKRIAELGKIELAILTMCN